jgi:hypothetical protein
MKYIYGILAFFYFTCSSAQSDLVDQWYRIDDRTQNPIDTDMPTQDSTILEVKELSGDLVGILIRIPKTSVDYGYAVGQIKWKNFKKTGDSSFELEGLLMEQGVSGKFDMPSYLIVYMQLVDNKNTILLWTDNQGDRFNWAKQKWIRLPRI